MIVELCYIDGLVSTGNQIPFTILKIIFPNQKIFRKNFIHILFYAVDKSVLILQPAPGELNKESRFEFRDDHREKMLIV